MLEKYIRLVALALGKMVDRGLVDRVNVAEHHGKRAARGPERLQELGTRMSARSGKARGAVCSTGGRLAAHAADVGELV
jgi:hypothetical protein